MEDKIPPQYKQFCNSSGVIACNYHANENCPGTCGMVLRLKQGTKTGIERFMERYPNWNQLGIGAMVVLPEGMSLGQVVDRVSEELNEDGNFDAQTEYFK